MSLYRYLSLYVFTSWDFKYYTSVKRKWLQSSRRLQRTNPIKIVDDNFDNLNIKYDKKQIDEAYTTLH